MLQEFTNRWSYLNYSIMLKFLKEVLTSSSITFFPIPKSLIMEIAALLCSLQVSPFDWITPTKQVQKNRLAKQQLTSIWSECERFLEERIQRSTREFIACSSHSGWQNKIQSTYLSQWTPHEEWNNQWSAHLGKAWRPCRNLPDPYPDVRRSCQYDVHQTRKKYLSLEKWDLIACLIQISNERQRERSFRISWDEFVVSEDGIARKEADDNQHKEGTAQERYW